jgi:hypothetical protein
MNRLHLGALGLLLASSAMSPALATCVSKKCSDAAAVEQARVTIQQTCGCMQGGSTHRAYMRCVKSALKAAELPALVLQRPCRNAVMRCESKSICGQPDAVVCCKTKKSGRVVASVRKSAKKCKTATACGATRGLYSTFDACGPTGGCAPLGATTTTTPTAATTTTTVAPVFTLGCGAERAAFEAGLPVPTPVTPERFVVQLVNESNVALLVGAIAAHRVNEPPFPVLPREGTWVIESLGVLTVDIPQQWENTTAEGGLGPVFWARTGCRYDIAHDIAQCETGSCGGNTGGFYDCSKANQTAAGPKSLFESAINAMPTGWSFPDVSVVDGVNINMDIVPIGPHTEHMPTEPRWLDHPLVKCGGDQRDAFWCPSRFLLKRSQLASRMFIEGTPGGDDPVACLSNCGRYKYPAEPTNFACNPDPATDLSCYYWKTFCATFPAIDGPFPYDIPCNSDADCPQGGACWNPCLPGENCRKCKHSGPNSKVEGGGPACCALRAFNKLPNCPPDQCTFPYTPQTPFNQPPFGLCSDVTNATGDPDACVGDDTFHYVMPYGLVWPNDPETFNTDAHALRIILAPGGTGIPITPPGPIPMCRDLPAVYGYAQAAMNCAIDINNGAVFSSAVKPPAIWPCKVTNASIPAGVLCRW